MRRELAKGNATLARGIDDIKQAVTPNARTRGLAGGSSVALACARASTGS